MDEDNTICKRSCGEVVAEGQLVTKVTSLWSETEEDRELGEISKENLDVESRLNEES